MRHDLFEHTEWQPQLVRLDRNVDRLNPCHDNIVRLLPSKPPHAAELRCATCGAHRGWIPKHVYGLLGKYADLAADDDIPTLRWSDATMGKDYDNTNRGALFRNDDKDGENDRDYSGTINIEGREFWLSGWIKTSKKTDKKFLSLSVKPKDAEKAKPKATAREEMDDEIPF